ncbi:MAG: hypothetical protein HY287_09590 [Planctomycetes bacterium]|nr:hypothetical protein [Planctomycetota bacterium]MBI3834565.1 hypothetical protein [Planctomycetota bacterium]
MTSGDGSEPIDKDEIVLRRIPATFEWYNPGLGKPIAWVAFKPNENDRSGISVWRRKYRPPCEVAARNAKPGRRYYVLGLRVALLRAIGITVEPSPLEGGPGHANLVNLSSDAYRRDKDGITQLAKIIAERLTICVDGPFGPFDIDARQE